MYNHDEVAGLITELRTLERIKGRSGAGSLDEAIAHCRRLILEKSQMANRAYSIEINTAHVDFSIPEFSLGTPVVIEEKGEGIIVGLLWNPSDDNWTYFVKIQSDYIYTCLANVLTVDKRPRPISNDQTQVLNGFLSRYEKNYGPAINEAAPSANGKHG